MSDFPTSGPQSTNAANLGLFDNESDLTINDNHSAGGDLFSAGGQADFFGGDDTVLNTSEGGNRDAILGSVPGVASSGALGSGKSTATPPPRPPPPASASNGTPRAMSPSIGGTASGRPAAAAPSKSAFDDLNDSIRMALGGSPSRPPPLAQQAPNPQQSQQQQQQPPQLQHHQQQQQQQPAQIGFAMFDMGGSMGGTGQPVMGGAPASGYGVPGSQAQVPMGYGSPAKQPMSGDESLRTPCMPCVFNAPSPTNLF